MEKFKYYAARIIVILTNLLAMAILLFIIGMIFYLGYSSYIKNPNGFFKDSAIVISIISIFFLASILVVWAQEHLYNRKLEKRKL